MRDFSKAEQQIIEKIVSARKSKNIVGLSLGDIITHEMEKVHCDIIDWRKDNGPVRFYYHKPATQSDVIFSFMDIIVLFEYLDREGLVHIIELENHSGQKAIFSNKKYKYDEVSDEYKLLTDDVIHLPKGKLSVKDSNILSYNVVSPLLSLKQLLDKYSHAVIYPTPTLENYVDNGYKTDEDIKFGKQYKQTETSIRIARVSCVIAFIIGLASIILNICMLCRDTHIDNLQQTEIIETIKDSRTIIPSTIDTRVINDTLKINIVNSIPITTKNSKQ